MNTQGGGPHFARMRDPDLQQLVEDYLSENWKQSYINIQDMIANLRSKSHRYARMNHAAFSSLVHKAYEEYCRVKASMASREIPGGTPDMAAVQQPIEDINDVSSDSDIEEIQEEPARTSITNNQLSNLYGSTNNKPSNSQGQLTYRQNSPVINQTPTPKKKRGNRSRSPSLIAIGSSLTPMADISSQIVVSMPKSCGGLIVTPLHGNTIEDKNGNHESDNDLEIIEEVPGEMNSKKSSDNQSPNDSVLSVQTFRSRPTNTPSQLTTIVSTSKTCDSVPDFGEQVPSKTDTQQHRVSLEKVVNNVPITMDWEGKKGVKRKLGKSNDENTVGTNTKKLKREVTVTNQSKLKLEDFAGSENVLEEICKLLMHLKHPEVYKCLGVTPPRGFLLHGPPGCGKTLLANAIAGELEMPMLKMAATELVSGVSGESESNIRDLFNQAVSLAPCIVFIDEIDAVTPKRETAQREMERRIVAQLLACIDELGTKEKGDQVLLIGATNRIETIDTGLRRAGRFDREICLGIPDVRAREKIIRVICRGLRLTPNFDFELLSKLTPGYVGADLQALTREAAVQAVNKILTKPITGPPIDEENSLEDDITEIANPLAPKMLGKVTSLIEKTENSQKDNLLYDSPLRWIKEAAPLTQSQLDELFICIEDFVKALKIVQPSSKREGFATVPDITWDDIGALQDIRDELQVAILGPVKHASAFLSLGLNTPAGSLLCGPPGVGKTLLAKAVANEAGINFISVKGPELLNMYVGESERAVRQCFLRARNSAPCVIFFDELDALCPRRSEVAESGSGSRIVNQLLTEMDGMESRLGVFVMAATNRPDIIDPAVLRPGRLDKIFFVDFPSANDRLEILKAITKKGTKPVLDDDVNLKDISYSIMCENYTGADLAALVREASIAAFRELVLHNVDGEKDLKVSKRHFEFALSRIRPSVSKEDREKYDKMKVKFSSITSGSSKKPYPTSKKVEAVSSKQLKLGDSATTSAKAVTPLSLKDTELPSVKDTEPLGLREAEQAGVKDAEPFGVKTVEATGVEGYDPVNNVIEVDPVGVKVSESDDVKDAEIAGGKDTDSANVSDVNAVDVKDPKSTGIKDVEPAGAQGIEPTEPDKTGDADNRTSSEVQNVDPGAKEFVQRVENGKSDVEDMDIDGVKNVEPKIVGENVSLDVEDTPVITIVKPEDLGDGTCDKETSSLPSL